MATCANKNLQEYKDLVSSEGEYIANYLWDKYEGDTEKIKSAVETPKNQTSLSKQKANLSERLSSFLDGLNFTTEFKDDLKEDSELNPLSLTDLIHKAILIRNDFKDEGLLKETAYVAYTMLGKKNKIRTDLIHSVENIPNYQERFDEYKERSPNLGDYKINELIVIDFLADAIKNNFESPKDSYINRQSEYWGIEGSSKLEKKFKYLLLKIKFFLENLFTNTKLSEKELTNLYDDIAKDIVNNFYDKYSKDKSPDSQLANYENTLSKDAKAKEIVEFFQKNGMILTGSLALRKAGTIYRSVKEDLHDLDFSFELNEFKKQIGNKLRTKIDIAEKLQQGIDITKEFKNNLESSDLIKNIKSKYPSFKVTNVFNGLGVGDITVQGDIDGYVIDIFVYTKTQTNLSTEETSFQDWVNIFKAKLKMGRDKDIRDFVNYIPFNKDIKKIASEPGFRHFTFNKKQKEKLEQQSEVYKRPAIISALAKVLENKKRDKDRVRRSEGTTNLREALIEAKAPQNLIDAISDNTLLVEEVLADNNAIMDSLMGLGGFFDPLTDTIHVGKLAGVIAGKNNLLIHEAVHAATLSAYFSILNRPEYFSKEQIDAVNELMSIATDYRLNTSITARISFPTLYGISDPIEFLAEFVANKNFRDYISTTSKDKKVNFVNYIWDKILRMLGVKPKDINTELLDKVQKTIDILYNVNKELNPYVNADIVNYNPYNSASFNFKDNTPQIKPGVEELFDSNPELANAVYEALGLGYIATDDTEKSDRKIDVSKPIITLSGTLIDGNKRLRTGKDVNELKINSFKNLEDNIKFLRKVENKQVKKLVNLYDSIKDKSIDRTAQYSEAEVSDLYDGKFVPRRNYTDEELFLNLVEEIKKEAPNYGRVITPQQKQQALQLYSQYLNTIFPDSQVKDIVYHGSHTEIRLYKGKEVASHTPFDPETHRRIENFDKLPIVRFENFKKKDHRQGGLDKFLGSGNYFTTSKKDAEAYGEKGVYSVIVNIKNPYTENKGYNNSRSGKGSQELVGKGYDAVTEKINNGQEYNVFEPEQIHILGGKQDIEGFKKFTKNNKEQKSEQSVYFNLSDPNYLLLSKENQRELKDLQNKGLISSKRVSKGINYTVPKVRTGSQSNRGIGNSEFILDVSKVKQLQNYIASNDIRWLKVTTTSNEAIVEVLPENQWELPLKPETKDNNQDKTTTELLTKLKSILNRLGIKLEKVDAIYEAQQEINSLNKKENKTANDIERIKTLKLQGIKKNALAMADILNSSIQVVDDQNPELLSEEVIHFLVDVIQQKDPALFADMIRQSSTYSKYKEVKARYEQGDINYTEDQLRKEILTHALVDYLLRDGSEVETDYQNEKSSRFWDKIKDFANNLFKSLINSDLDAFQEFFNKTLNSDYVSKEDIEGLNANKYYNIKNTLSKEALRDNFLTKKALFSAKVKVGELERYVYDGKTVLNRVSDFISEFYESLFKNKEISKKRIDMLAAERGTILHKIIEEFFNSYIDEKTGEVLKTSKPDSPQLEKFKRLNPKITAKLDTFVKEIIQEYPDAFFLTEMPIINRDNTIAGTIDLIIIDKNNRVHVFDWKSKKNIYYDITTKSWQERADIPWWNKLGWVRQIDMYVSILKDNYGVNDFGRMRAIPIMTKEDFSNNSVTIVDVSVAPFNKSNIDIKKRELIPVISPQEKTHKTELDKLLLALHGIKESISKKLNQKSSNRDILREDLSSIENLITDLVVAESMESLIKNVTLLLKNSAEFLEKRQKITPGFTLQKDGIQQYLEYLDTLTKEQVEKELLELNETLKSLLVYAEIEQVKNEILFSNSKDAERLNKSFSLLSSSIRNAITNFTLLKNTAFDKFAQANGVQNISAIDIGQNFIDKFYSFFTDFYSLSFKTGALLSNILRKMDDDIREDNKRDSAVIQGFRDKFLRGFETRNASVIFKNLFHTTKDGNVRLTAKIKKEFYEELEKQRVLFEEGLANAFSSEQFFKSDKYKEILKWIEENIDVDKFKESFNKRKEEYLNKIKELNKDEEEIVRDYILEQKEQSFEYFNNIFNSPQAFRQFAESIFVKEEKWHSDEYKKIKSNPLELEIYNYFRSLNKRAIELGYLPGWGNMSFIPNITPTTEILRHPFAYLKGYITPNSDSVDDEEFGFSKINPITGAEEFPLKTPFTRELELNGKKLKSLDLFYAFESFAHELNRYENLKNVEEISKAIVELEQTKTQVYEKGTKGNINTKPTLKTPGVFGNSNYEAVISDFMKYKLYGKKLEKDIVFADKFSFLKSLAAFDTYVTLLYLGSHYIAAGGAYIGSYGIGVTNSGKTYKKRDFVKSTIANVPSSMDINPLHTNSKILSDAFNYRIIQKEKEELNFKRANTIKKIAILGWKYAVNVMSVVDDAIQENTFFAALRSHHVINGKIVNDYDYKVSLTPDFYSLSKEQQNKAEKKEQSELSKHPTLYDWALKNIKNGKLDLSKLDKESVTDFNSLVKGTNKTIIGNMSSEDYFYGRIGIAFAIGGKFKTWFSGVAKGYFDTSFSNEHVYYNKETKSAKKGRVPAFVAILTAFLQDKDSKTQAFFKNTLNLILPFHLKNNKDLNKVMRSKYKEYVDGANTYGYEVNISEREFIDTYYTQAKAITGNLYLLLALSILVNLLGGGDPDKRLKFLPDIIKRGMKELYSLLTPPTLLAFATKMSFPHFSALLNLFDVPISIVKDNSLTESLQLQYYKHFNKDAYYPYKNKIDKQNKIGKVVKETIETIPVVSNLTKTFVVPNSKEAQKFLNVDKNFREN